MPFLFFQVGLSWCPRRHCASPSGACVLFVTAYVIQLPHCEVAVAQGTRQMQRAKQQGFLAGNKRESGANLEKLRLAGCGGGG